MIILVIVRQPSRDSPQAGTFRGQLMMICICPPDDQGKRLYGSVLNLMLPDKIIESAFCPIVCVFHSRNIKRGCRQLPAFFQYLVIRHVDDLCLSVDEPPDKPGTGKAIDLWFLPCDPFHSFSLIHSSVAFTSSD